MLGQALISQLGSGLSEQRDLEGGLVIVMSEWMVEI